MTQKLTCSLKGSSTEYDIVIHDGLLSDRNKLIELLKPYGSRFAIIADDIVLKLYGRLLSKIFSDENLEAFLFAFPSGEQSKTRETKAALEDQMLAKGLGRDTCVIAIGGGVSTDLGGYVAATYCRGVPLVMIPTSLLGMVDASIGGKTGVNVPLGKNMIGCIYQPKAVLIDPRALQSLSDMEIRNGVAEMIKHGLIADRQLFELLEQNSEKVLSLDFAVLQKAIYDSCRIKRDIVETDEKETGKRRLLNFGHTVGHAIERVKNYTIPHGEAVSIGILAESDMAVQLGRLDPKSFEKISNILKIYGLPQHLPEDIAVESLLEAMSLDKKSLGGRPRFVIIDKIGSAINFEGNYCTHVDDHIILASLQRISHDLHKH